MDKGNQKGLTSGKHWVYTCNLIPCPIIYWAEEFISFESNITQRVFSSDNCCFYSNRFFLSSKQTEPIMSYSFRFHTICKHCLLKSLFTSVIKNRKETHIQRRRIDTCMERKWVWKLYCVSILAMTFVRVVAPKGAVELATLLIARCSSLTINHCWDHLLGSNGIPKLMNTSNKFQKGNFCPMYAWGKYRLFKHSIRFISSL